MDTPALNDKLQEIGQELRRLGLWQHAVPQWLSSYASLQDCNGISFLTWLQYVYLPNKGHYGRLWSEDFIAPQAVAFLETVPEKGKLLQLLVELDALI